MPLTNIAACAASIPAAMQQAKRWLVWKSIPNADPTKKPRKVPFYVSGIPRNGAMDTPEDAAQFGTYDDAVRALSTGAYAGLGFALGDGWQGVDLDGMTQRPMLYTIAADLMRMTYCETSPNGDGIHAIGYGTPFASMGSTSDGIEAYAGGRFFTVTGASLGAEHVADLAQFVERDLRPRRGTVAPSVPLPPVARLGDAVATAEQVVELRSALLHMRSDDRGLWVDIGMALKSLGDMGRGLWMEWSAQSDKFDPLDAARTWDSFRPNSTDYRAVFAKAQAAGWINPKARQPVQFNPFGGGTVAAAPVACRDITGSTFASIDDQRKIFEGCVYVRQAHKVLVPGGKLLDAQRFNASAPWNRFTYMLDEGNERTTRKAFEALTNSQALDWQQADDTCFRPELPPAHITQDGLVNTWWPIETPSEPGDVGPFLRHLEKLLPVKRDRDILLNYAAALVQFPGDKFQWWPIIQGAEGNGKTLLLEVLEFCVGARYCHRPNASEIAGGGGKFTGWLDGKILVGFEEVKTNHKAEVLEILKPIVTNNRLEIQNKGVDQVTKDNRANGIMHSNYKDAIAIAMKNRRYAPFFTAQQSEEDLERDGMTGSYFPKLYRWLRQEGGLAHLNHFFRTMPLERELNPALDHGGEAHRRPVTSSLDEAIAVSLGKVEQEVVEAIAEGRDGFCGGWVSSVALDKLLSDKRMEGLVPRIKRPEMMRSLGYVHHPGLTNGRASTPTNGGQRPVFYVRDGHIAANITGGAAITRAFEAAQLQRVFGVDTGQQVA